MKYIIFLCLIFSPFAFAGKNDTAVGIHGMALLKIEDEFIASHMPLHASIHAHQVLFKVKFAAKIEQQLSEFFLHHNLISLKPELFDLHKLMCGELREFKTDIVLGHFERDGKTEVYSAKIQVTELLLAKPIMNVDNGAFYQIEINSSRSLLVHRIGNRSSFDEIILVSSISLDKAHGAHNIPLIKLSKNNYPLSELNHNELLDAFSMQYEKLLYLETGDFQIR